MGSRSVLPLPTLLIYTRITYLTPFWTPFGPELNIQVDTSPGKGIISHVYPCFGVEEHPSPKLKPKQRGCATSTLFQRASRCGRGRGLGTGKALGKGLGRGSERMRRSSRGVRRQARRRRKGMRRCQLSA